MRHAKRRHADRLLTAKAGAVAAPPITSLRLRPSFACRCVQSGESTVSTPSEPSHLRPYQQVSRIEKKKMSNGELESWSKVQQRLRAEVGEDIYSSWFARMDLEAIDEETVRMSVPTRFL